MNIEDCSIHREELRLGRAGAFTDWEEPEYPFTCDCEDSELTDDEIRQAILEHFQCKLLNFNEDNLFEGPCNCNEQDYYRAIELLIGAELYIKWSNNEG